MSKLQAKDLMIGDYVLNTHNNPEKVQQIIANFNDELAIMLDGNCIYGSDEIAPIPLTTKILEENGWKSYSHENTPIWGMIQGFEIVLAWMSYYWQLCVDGTIYRKIQIKHVHELQHALKLCGIEKEIEL